MFIGFHLIVSYSFGFLFGFLGVVEFAETHANMGVLDPSKMHAKSCKHDQMWKDRFQSGRAGEHSNNLYASMSACVTERTFQHLLLLLSFTREACCGFEPGQSWEDLNSQIAQGPLPPWQHPSHYLRGKHSRGTQMLSSGWKCSIKLAPIAVCSILCFVCN